MEHGLITEQKILHIRPVEKFFQIQNIRIEIRARHMVLDKRAA